MTWLESVWRDIRHAARALAHSPAFSITAVLSLALGIGATTTIFSVVHAVVIDPFPYRSPETLLSLAAVGPNGRGNFSTYTIDEYVELTERATVFEGLIASTISDVSLTGSGAPERLRGNYVSMNTFDVMRSFLKLQGANAGFETAPLMTQRVYLPGSAYAEPGAKRRQIGRASCRERV